MQELSVCASVCLCVCSLTIYKVSNLFINSNPDDNYPHLDYPRFVPNLWLPSSAVGVLSRARVSPWQTQERCLCQHQSVMVSVCRWRTWTCSHLAEGRVRTKEGMIVQSCAIYYMTCDLWVSIPIWSKKKGSRLGHPGISGPTYCLTSWSSVVRALVCQPSGPGSNPGSLVQSQILQEGTQLE